MNFVVLSRFRVIVIALAISILINIPIATPAQAADDDWIWCSARSFGFRTSRITIYYSGVFLGDYSRKTKYANAFHKYLDARYGRISRSGTYCFFENDRSEAREERDDDVSDKRKSNYRGIVFTNWTY